MGRAIKSELLKLFTTRLWWGMAIGVVLVATAFAVGFGFLYTSEAVTGDSGPAGSATPEQLANSVYTGGLSTGYLLLLTIGVMQIGMEYRHQTITSTFLAIPRRASALGAKVIALMLIGIGYGVLFLVCSVIPGAVVLSARGAEAFPTGGVFRTFVLSLLVLGLWALIGLGFGILIPNQVAAILIAVGLAWIVEPLLAVLLGLIDFAAKWIVPVLPSSATQAIVNGINQGMGDEAQTRLSWWGGLIALAVWAAVLSGLGVWRASRQDLS